MKKTLVLFAALVAGASLHAQSQTPKSSYSVTTDFTYTSEYVFRGVQITKDSFQPSVEVSVGDFYVNLWTNQPITRHENNGIDVSAGYRQKVGNALSLEALGTFYWYPEARFGATKQSFEGGIGATYAAAGFSPSLYYYHNFDLQANTLEGSIGYSIAAPNIGTSLDMSVYAGTSKADDAASNSGVIVKEAYNYYGVDLRAPYQLSQNAKLTLGAHWATNEGYVRGTLKNRLWFDIGFTAGF